MSADRAFDPQIVKGFLEASEGKMLAHYARKGAELGEVVEIGGWCGRSAIFMGQAMVETDRLFFSIDHHRGSEENQPGWEWFDEQVWDDQTQAIDTLPHFRANIRAAGLEGKVVPVIGPSPAVGQAWGAPLGFLFLDGNHVMDAALADYQAWARHVVKDGFLAIHDVFPDPADGGRPPYEISCMAEQSGEWKRVDETGSLVVLKRL